LNLSIKTHFAICRKTRFPPRVIYLKLNFKQGKAISATRLPSENAFPQLALPRIFDFRHEKYLRTSAEKRDFRHARSAKNYQLSYKKRPPPIAFSKKTRFPQLALRRIFVFTLQNALFATRLLPENAFFRQALLS